MNIPIKPTVIALLLCIGITACQNEADNNTGTPASQDTGKTEASAQQPNTENSESAVAERNLIAMALGSASRTAADIERDQRSKPADVLGLLDLSPGQTVMDIFGGGGYYSEIIAHIVGPEGKVLLHNNQPYLNFVKDALAERKQRLSLPQLEYYDREVDDFGLASDSLDAAMIIMSYHDLYYVDPDSGWSAIDSQNFLEQICKALKPGGKFLIVDHAATDSSGNTHAQTLHRIEESFAIQDIENNGFKLVGSSDALRSSEDDHTIMVFDDAIRGKTDRFILLFEKNAD